MAGVNLDESLTEMPVYSTTYYWRIRGLEYLADKVGESIHSKSFHTYRHGQKCEGISWHLTLYPKGQKEESQGYCSVFLMYNGHKQESLYASYVFHKGKSRDSILTSLNEEKRTQRHGTRTPCNLTDQTFKNTSGFGTPKFINLSSETDLVHGEFVIACYVQHPGFKSSISTVNPPMDNAESAGDSSKNTNTSDNITLRMYNDGILTDTEIIVEDNKFKVHKLALAAKSPVFQKLFVSDFSEASTNIIEINDIGKEACEVMILHMYGDKVPPSLSIDVLEELLHAAEKYQLDELKLICEKAIRVHVTPDTIGRILIASDRYGASNLRRWSHKYIKDNWRNISTNSSWTAAMAHQPQQLFDLISSILAK